MILTSLLLSGSSKEDPADIEPPAATSARSAFGDLLASSLAQATEPTRLAAHAPTRGPSSDSAPAALAQAGPAVQSDPFADVRDARALSSPPPPPTSKVDDYEPPTPAVLEDSSEAHPPTPQAPGLPAPPPGAELARPATPRHAAAVAHDRDREVASERRPTAGPAATILLPLATLAPLPAVAREASLAPPLVKTPAGDGKMPSTTARDGEASRAEAPPRAQDMPGEPVESPPASPDDPSPASAGAEPPRLEESGHARPTLDAVQTRTLAQPAARAPAFPPPPAAVGPSPGPPPSGADLASGPLGRPLPRPTEGVNQASQRHAADTQDLPRNSSADGPALPADVPASTASVAGAVPGAIARRHSDITSDVGTGAPSQTPVGAGLTPSAETAGSVNLTPPSGNGLTPAAHPPVPGSEGRPEIGSSDGAQGGSRLGAVAGATHAEVVLPTLGRVSVSAHGRDGVVDAQITASSPAAARELQGHVEGMTAEVRAADVPLRRLDVGTSFPTSVAGKGASEGAPDGRGRGSQRQESQDSTDDDGSLPAPRRLVRIVL